MTFVKSWQEFEKSVEHLYLANPMKVRYTMKYAHTKGSLVVKVTDDVKCVQFKTDSQSDLKNVNALVGNLMKHMASKED